MSFKVGDRVRVNENYTDLADFVGMPGRIEDVVAGDIWPYHVLLDNGKLEYYAEHELDLIHPVSRRRPARLTVELERGAEITRYESVDGRSITFEGDFTYSFEESEEPFVQVLVPSASTTYLWTYYDPSGELQVGDFVRVPFGWNDRLVLGEVRALGKGSVPAHAKIKDVSARFVEQELAA